MDLESPDRRSPAAYLPDLGNGRRVFAFDHAGNPGGPETQAALFSEGRAGPTDNLLVRAVPRLGNRCIACTDVSTGIGIIPRLSGSFRESLSRAFMEVMTLRAPILSAARTGDMTKQPCNNQ